VPGVEVGRSAECVRVEGVLQKAARAVVAGGAGGVGARQRFRRGALSIDGPRCS